MNIRFNKWDRDRGCRRHPADPDRPLYVDRRFRPRPHGGAGAEAALAEPAGRPADDLPLRPAGRLHAGRPRRDRLGPAAQPACGRPGSAGLAAELRARGYGTALVLPRTWKAAIAPALAGIPERVGFFGEARFGLINRMRWGEKALPRFIDKNAALALPDGAPLPPEWPVPQLRVPAEEASRWRQANGLGTGPAVALAPGLGRRLQALDLLSGGRAALGRTRPRRLGGRRPRRKGAGAGDRGRRRPARPRPHRHRSAQRHSGDGGGQRRDLQRLPA